MAETRKATGKGGAARGGAGAGAKGGGKARPRGGLAQPVKPDAALAAVIGSDSRTRADVTKAIWDYVKANNLQDPADRRTIRADGKLKPLFGGKDRVTMFEMTRLISQHLS